MVTSSPGRSVVLGRASLPLTRMWLFAGAQRRARAGVPAVDADVVVLDQLAGVAARQVGHLVGGEAVEALACILGADRQRERGAGEVFV